MISLRDDAQQWPVNCPVHLFRLASASQLSPPPPLPWAPVIVTTFHPTSDGPEFKPEREQSRVTDSDDAGMCLQTSRD